MQGEAAAQLRAWVEYFRDLGVHDFYRSGEDVAEADDVDQPAPAEAMLEQLSAAADLAVAVAPVQSYRIAEPPREPVPPPIASEPGPIVPPGHKLLSFNNLAPLPGTRIPPAERVAALRAIQEEIGDCTRCPLAYAGRRKIV